MVRQVRREGLGVARGRLVIWLRLRGDVWLVWLMKVHGTHVNRMWRRLLTEERVQSLGRRGVRWREHRGSVREMGV